MTSQPELLAELEQLAERTDIRDELKAALREGRNKSEQLKAKREARPVATDEVALDAVGDQSGQLDSRSTSVNPGQPEDSTEVENPLAPREGYMSDKQIDDRIDLVWKDERIALCARGGAISTELLNRLESKSTGERAAALNDLAQLGGDDAFHLISRAFDDQSPDVRNAAARALYDLDTDRVASFTRALHDGSLDRRRRIGASLAACGLASDAIANLTAESREKTYDAFSLLFLMAKTGEVQPLLRAMENYPSSEIRLAVVTLLALSGQPDIVPALKRLSVRGSQPTDVRSALMEAINRINSQSRETV